MGFRLPWEADAAPTYDGPITLTPDGGPFLYNDAVPYEMLLAAGVIIPSYKRVPAVRSALTHRRLAQCRGSEPTYFHLHYDPATPSAAM